MRPERKTELKRHKIEEFYWAGEMVVYVNNRLSNLAYEHAVEMARRSEASNDEIDALEAALATPETEAR